MSWKIVFDENNVKMCETVDQMENIVDEYVKTHRNPDVNEFDVKMWLNIIEYNVTEIKERVGE